MVQGRTELHILITGEINDRVADGKSFRGGAVRETLVLSDVCYLDL